VLDIAIVTLIFYKLYTVIRGTIASQIFLGLVIVLFLSFVAQAANFKALGWLLRLISDIWVIAFIILFQPEIRRLLVLLAKNPLIRPYVKTNAKNVANILTDTAFELAQFQHGALIVIVRSTGIRGVVETGEEINAKVNKNLIRSIFFPRSPLHDGAVIIKGDTIEAARCTLPLSTETSYNGIPLGMRHRAGLGITEQADVISLIVSEETGGISIADNGELKRGLSKESLRTYLEKNLNVKKEKNYFKLFEQFSFKK
ncbi:MAG: TIGR00159 family protein, partial [Ignavibacteria bacterium]